VNMQQEIGIMKNGAWLKPLRMRSAMIEAIRAMSFRGLQRMFRPQERLFVFRFIRSGDKIVPQGLSLRYTAIAMIGLADEDEAAVRGCIGGLSPHDVCARLISDAARSDNLGNIALALWAASVSGYGDRGVALNRLADMKADQKPYPTVEAAWALEALCHEPGHRAEDLQRKLAQRLIQAFNPDSGAFPHALGDAGSRLRSHVSCFADMVYPIHALSTFAKRWGDSSALDAARRCGDQICRLQGSAGQWWWHYDYRTGRVVEHYPVYSVHQDGMAPMALFALDEAGGGNHAEGIARGLDWIGHAPEVDSPLADKAADLIWRKVGRREPKKVSRYLQAIASRLHPECRVPGLNRLFPADVVDYETRPYHLGWLLFAWNPRRMDAIGRAEHAD
jgi:hypothetical protein